MALLNAEDFGELAGVSASQAVRKPGKFFNVNICGKRRGDNQPGTYQCPKSYDDNNSEYFIHNGQSVNFIPLYIKRFWTKYEKATSQNGQEYNKLVAFGWDEKKQKIEGAKTEYIVAGYLLNEKGIVKHDKDMDDREIKAGDPVLIYFKCQGVKCGCAFDLINRCSEAAARLTPLSNNPTFEKNVVSIRRFAIQAGITSRDTSHGAFDVFDFKIAKQLPDATVGEIINKSKEFLTDFDYQFDKTESVQNGGESVSEQLIDQGSGGTDTSVTIDEVPSTVASASNDDQFSIDL